MYKLATFPENKEILTNYSLEIVLNKADQLNESYTIFKIMGDDDDCIVKQVIDGKK